MEVVMSEAASGMDFNNMSNMDLGRLSTMKPEEVEALAMGQDVKAADGTMAEGDPTSKAGDTANDKDQAGEAGKKDVAGESSSAPESTAKQQGESDKEYNFRMLRERERRVSQELEQERLARADLERQLGELKKDDSKTSTTDLAEVDAKIADLRAKAKEVAEDAPSIAAEYNAVADQMASMRDQVAAIATQRKEAEEVSQRTAEQTRREEEQKAIDGIPVLAYWQANDHRAFDAATAEYMRLSAMPGWQDRPIKDRIEKAAELAQVLIPDALRPDAPAASNNEKPTGEKPAEQATTGMKPPIGTLSDIAGGSAPAKDLLEQVGELSAAALGNRFMKMTPEQQMAELSRLELGQ